MRPHCVEVPTPGLDDHASLCEGIEDLAVEKFIAQSCIEGLDEAILPRTARRDVGGLGALWLRRGAKSRRKFTAWRSPVPVSYFL